MHEESEVIARLAWFGIGSFVGYPVASPFMRARQVNILFTSVLLLAHSLLARLQAALLLP